jgi:hypothetical protein
MKKTAFILLLAAIVLPLAAATDTVSDTTIVVDNRKIKIEDRDDRIEVRVYEQAEDGDFVESEMIFEGHYRGEDSYERRKFSKTITLPAMHARNLHGDRLAPHWDGIGIGFNHFADTKGIPLSVGRSLEYTFNFFEKGFRFSKRSRFMFVTGLGMKWNRYHLSSNAHFQKVDGILTTVPADDGVKYTKTRMGVNSFTLPLLFEWQAKGRSSAQFFLSAGAVGTLNYLSASKVKYVDHDGKKRKEKMDADLNVNLFTVDLLLQAGFGEWNLYAKYSPVELFKKNEGPSVQPISAGVFLNF